MPDRPQRAGDATGARQLLESVEQFELTEEQRAELREAMAEIDRGEHVDGDVLLLELGVNA